MMKYEILNKYLKYGCFNDFSFKGVNPEDKNQFTAATTDKILRMKVLGVQDGCSVVELTDTASGKPVPVSTSLYSPIIISYIFLRL